MKRVGFILIWCLMCLITGCLGGSRPAPLISHYALEYPTPPTLRMEPLASSLRVERFSAARLYAGPEMIIRRGPYRFDPYHEQRWRVSPADLVGDMLRRDLLGSGLFRAVMAARDREETQYLLEGGVEEFLEAEGSGGRSASLAVTVALIDQSQPGKAVRRLLFQKTYRLEEPYTQPGGQGLAAAMSRAMARCSAQVTADIEAALKQGR